MREGNIDCVFESTYLNMDGVDGVEVPAAAAA
jgi:hypothetical protein